MTVKTTTRASCDNSPRRCGVTQECHTTQPYLELRNANWGIVHIDDDREILTFCPIHRPVKKESNP